MRKFLFFLSVFSLTCTLFHREMIGAALKLFLNSKTSAQLTYRSLELERGGILFQDLALFDPALQLSAKTLFIQFDWSLFPKKLKGCIDIEEPHIALLEKKAISFEENFFEFTLKVNHGTLDWGGLAHFSLDKGEERTFLSLDWDDASALVFIEKEKVDLELDQFDLKLLKEFFPYAEITGGQVSGRLSLKDFKAPILASLSIENGKFCMPYANIEGLKGSLSYNASIGAKWVLEGAGVTKKESFPLKIDGRGFFKSGWIETELTFKDSYKDSWFRAERDKFWKIECEALSAAQATLLQQVLVTFYPSCSSFQFVEGRVSGKGTFDLPYWNLGFDSKSLKLKTEKGFFECDLVQGVCNQEGGEVFLSRGEDTFKASGFWDTWRGSLHFQGMDLALSGGWDGEKVPVQITQGCFEDISFLGSGWVDPNLNLSFSLDGEWSFLERKIPFACPLIAKSEDIWTFDFRVLRDSWDLCRLYATYDGAVLTYGEKSHLLGAPLHFSNETLKELKVETELSFKQLQSAASFFNEWGVDVKKLPPIDQVSLSLQKTKEDFQCRLQGNSPFFSLCLLKDELGWTVDLESELFLKAKLQEGGKVEGSLGFKDLLKTDFKGKVFPNFHLDLSLPQATFDLSLLEDERLKGTLCGSGHLIYNGQIESDFDLSSERLILNDHPMENSGKVHLSYFSDKGAKLKGVNLHGPFDCIIDILEYDKQKGIWSLQNGQIHIPASFVNGRLSQFIDKDKDLNFTADLQFASDFSSCICTMREGWIPFKNEYHRVENLKLRLNQSKYEASFNYLDHFCFALFHLDEEEIYGKLALGSELNPMTIEWNYKDTLKIHAIEGAFGGINASLHSETPDVLVGSFQVDFAKLSKVVPEEVGKAFQELEMGSGYEFKGRVEIKDSLPYFRGILSGKSIELFGFQFRTLLSQAELSPKKIHLFDLKISDSAGSLKLDELLIEKKAEAPFTIDIPSITILDLRPSFLVRPGKGVGPIEPLVVRELKFKNFKGLLDEPVTWTGDGTLNFINSYKRQETVFDLPANLLSRIAGLDLELLIPVKGALSFDLKDGYFNLNELKNSYSEANRSEFFLEMDPQPRMSLDGDLRIYIKMKQFVLLKITESFLISIDGGLSDPQFHLKKKKILGIF